MTDVSETATPAQFELRDYLNILLRRSWVVILTLAVVVATALTLSYRKDRIYSSTAFVTVNGVAGNSPLSTELELVRSKAVSDVARQKNPNIGGVRARQSGQPSSIIMSLESRDSDPARAALTANTYADAYIEYKNADRAKRAQQQIDRTNALLAETTKPLLELSNELDARNLAIDTEFSESGRPQQPGETLRDYNTRLQQAQLKRDRDRNALAPLVSRRNSLLNQQNAYEAKLREDTASLLSIDSGRVITPATPSTSPVSPEPFNDGVTAALAGLLLGLALAFLVEYLDDSLKRREQLDRAVGDIPVIGQIPTFSLKRPSSLVTFADPQSAAAEAFRSLRTSVQFIGIHRSVRTVAITSASAGEGKSTIIANLAVVLAGAGKQVVLIDCDLRRPTLHRFYGRAGMDPSVGITSVIIGEATLNEALQEVTGIPRLFLLPSGPMPPNPSELLSSQAFVTVLEELKSLDDVVVLIDAPPVLPVTDAVVIAGLVDQMVLVVSAGTSSRSKVKQAIERLARVGARPSGVVFNHSEEEVVEAYGYVEKGRGWRKRKDAGTETSLTRFDPSRPHLPANGGAPAPAREARR